MMAIRVVQGGSGMLHYSCAAAGADTCGFKTTATDRTDLARQLAEHLKVHRVNQPTQTIVRYLIKVAEDSGNLVEAPAAR
jgi:predicted small metal-binding protein